MSALFAAAAKHGNLSNGELIAITAVTLIVLLLVETFFAYTIFKQPWENIRESNVFALIPQIGIAVLVIFVIVILMFRDVISTDAGVPVITGVVGLIFGKGWDVSKKV
jgi:FlaA1/EpsC-like NDP-sugar epimerase